MRTWLFAPGHEARKVEKALASEADYVILDWEDAVPRAEKESARSTTLRALEPLQPPELARIVVRINHSETEHAEGDLRALEGLPLGAVMLPKVEDEEQIRIASGLDLSMVLIIESALGVVRSADLASCHARVRYLAFGPLDLMADVGGHWTVEGEETLYARSKMPIVARAMRLDGALDGPFPRLRDLEGLRADTERGRRMGYVGRLLIHPEQIEPVRLAFAPSEEELEFARRVVEAARQGAEEGIGAVAVDGRFVDAPVVRWAESVLRESD